MIPSTADRVPQNTSEYINAWIRQKTQDNVARTIASGNSAIGRRLDALEREWDVERLLEMNASALVVLGTALAARVDRRWLLLPAAVGAFLLQHAVQGWCPPLPVLRRLGFRTQDEINRERYALKALRGDFAHISGQVDGSPERAMAAVER